MHLQCRSVSDQDYPSGVERGRVLGVPGCNIHEDETKSVTLYKVR